MERNEIWLQTARGLASGSTGDKATVVVPGGQFDVVRAEVTWEGTSVHATVAVIKFDKRPTANSDTGRGNGDVGVITKTAADVSGKTFYTAPAAAITVDAGDEIVVEVTTANGDAVGFSAAVKLRERPEAIANLPNAVLSA